MQAHTALLHAGPSLWTRRHALAGGAVLLLAGCGSKPKPGEPPPPPATGGIFKPSIASIGGDLVAAADLNPSASARPSPLPLRIFELKAATAFNKADFLPLYQTELQALGDEMLTREEIVLAPGETRPIQKVLNADTRFIGVFGAYRSFERAVWRAIAPVQPGKKHQLQIRAASLAVSIQLLVV
jgi:type VI secretion system protein VasD